MNLDEHRKWVNIIRDCKTRKKEYDELEAHAKAVLKEALGDEEEGVLDGEVAVRWKRAKRTSLNQGLLKKMHPDVAEECRETKEVRTFTVVTEDDA